MTSKNGEQSTAESVELPAVRFAHESEEEFARILDFYGIVWQYEPRTFPLRTDGDKIVEAFTPDFYLPAHRHLHRADDAPAGPDDGEAPQAAHPASSSTQRSTSSC